MENEKIYDFLTSNYEKVLEIEEIPTIPEFKNKYPKLKEGNKVEGTLQLGEDTFSLSVGLNIVTERLYYSIENDAGESLTTFRPVIPYPYNLNQSREAIGGELVFYENIFYWRTTK